MVMENPYFKSQFIFFLFDLVHLFKDIYNNLVNYGEYTCPSFDDFNKSIRAKFSHVHELYRLELSSPLQRAHKLTDKVLHPSSIEKTNVMLADKCFHECTINGLNFYDKRGHPEFLETAKVFTIFRQWFDFFNVKSQYLTVYPSAQFYWELPLLFPFSRLSKSYISAGQPRNTSQIHG